MTHRFAVGIDKIVGYLLNPTHEDGASKAAFFTRFGFSAERPEILAEALLAHARLAPSQVISNRWGTRYVVEGPIASPDSRNPTVRTVWQTPTPDDPIARLSTAIPLRPKL